MSSTVRAALARALSISALLALTAPLFAAEAWEAPPFAADPKALLAMAASVKAGDAEVVVLLDEGTYSFEADGRSRRTLHMIEYVVTQDGIERVATQRARWAPWYDQRPVLQARVIAKDGTVHTLDPKAVVDAAADEEEDMFSDERVVRAPLPGVAEGSIVETVVTMDGRSPIEGAGKSGDFVFRYDLPVEHARLIIDTPASLTPHVVNRAHIEPRMVEKDGRRQMIFERGHADAITQFEWYLPHDVTLFDETVAFSTGTTWRDIAANYSKIVDQQLAGSDVKALVASAVGNSTDKKEIAARLLAAVQKNVHYAGVEVADGSIVPRAPKLVLANKYGDCKDKATLLVAMLRAAGIPAHVALVTAGSVDDVLPELPGVNRFNHAIVSIDGEPSLWIDPTDEFARVGELPIEDQGRLALIAAPETTSVTRTPELPSTATRYVETRTFTLPEDGKAQVVEVTEGFGAEDSVLRRQYASADKTKYRESMEKYAKDYYVAPTFEKFDAGDPHDMAKPFRVSVAVSKSKMGIVDNGDGAVGITLSGLLSELPSILLDKEEKSAADAQAAEPEKKRVHEFLLPRPMVKEWSYRIVPATGYVARTLPQNETTKLGTMTFTSDYRADGNGVVLAKLTLDTGKRRLTAAEFEETRTALSKFQQREMVLIGFDAAGQAKLNAGDVSGALDEFRRMAALHPKEAQHHLELARALLAGGLGEAAREEAKRAVAVEPSNAKAQMMLAEVLQHDLLGRKLHRGADLAGAIAALRKAKQLDPTDPAARGTLALLLTYGDDNRRFDRNAHLDEAIAEYTSLIKDLGKDGHAYEPPLMLVLAHAGRWKELAEVNKTTTDPTQRAIFRVLLAAVNDGPAAAIRELNAFDAEKRRSYGAAVGQTLLALGKYDRAAGLFEELSKGSANANALAALIQALHKAATPAKNDWSRQLVLDMMNALLTGDAKALAALLTPRALEHDDSNDGTLRKGDKLAFSTRAFGDEVTIPVLIDIINAMMTTQVEGSDELGYRVRLRMNGAPAAEQAMFVEKNGAKYLLAGFANEPATVGDTALDLANAGKLDAARTWLNWARESVSAGGGDDPLAGPPFAQLWKKETQSATADEIKLAAASLMLNANYAPIALPVLVSLRDRATTDAAKTAVQVALAAAYTFTKDWAKALPIAESLSKANPDSASVFRVYVSALAHSGKAADAEAAAQARLAAHPKNREAMQAMYELAARKGDYDAAAGWVQRIIDELTPTGTDYNDAAWLELFRGKDLAHAAETARRASESAAVLNTLAAVYAHDGKPTEARQVIMKAIDQRTSDEPSSDDWYVLGRIAETYGVRDSALAAYKRVQKQDANGLSTWELTQKRLALLEAKK